MKRSIIILLSIISLTSCTTVESGHKGVKVFWGGETDMSKVYPEGMDTGLSWVWNDMVEYDVREKTLVKKFEFNDKNNMNTTVELSLDYNLNPDKVNILHTKITDIDSKILKTLKSAGKEVVPQYSAVELNINKRTEAEEKLSKILREELPDFYVDFARLQMTDVDIPVKVAQLAEETAVQLGRNDLAEKKEAEQTALAKAKIAKSKGEYESAQYEAKTKDILSQPKMLKLKELEIELEWAKKGISKYGSNNIFGGNTAVVKGLK
ncbi:Regulator of protease activity HflC, stomatin/prohibitin superfamily [Tenacibaculum maritimum]|uniref:SPFH domain-containing protein n=1 Tax=Tenacibaculum maritimum TaxID=107401 RepID=UPI0012E601C6|nr:SPFH domain-containing protein [Tenacibaculum maritimum]CAA0186252.1 Regulator of protease activity HflC, stomatin/prohibitin superfamily [Tenacibaculum maritimum]